jgi:hypothetical protein
MIDWVSPLKRSWPFIFIGWGGLTPQGILLQLEICKDSSILLGLGVHRSDRCGRCRIGYKTPHRSDRWGTPVWPAASAWSALCQIWVRTYAPLFFSKACCLKNNPKVDVTLHRPFFGLRAIFALNRPYPIKHPARHLDEISSSTSR